MPHWPPEQSAYVREHYGKTPTEKIAVHLRRSVRSIYHHAESLGLTVKRDQAKIAERSAKIAELHAKGLTTREIARDLGVDKKTVLRCVHRLGKTPSGRNERYRRQVAETTRQQCEAAGVSGLPELRSQRRKQVARRAGWPDHLSLRAVHIMEILYHVGPMTRKQIAAATRVEWRGSRKTFACNGVPGGSYLAELQRAGLVVRLRAAITHKGRGNREDLYLAALEAEPCPE